ncbi:hypothetical protein BDN67DRAFT_1016817 [Paxillus ammoniavirescens]|nr:hypothetical protein BDN67DRAFT_1016817 [Paxillus ammoniavirescens]
MNALAIKSHLWDRLYHRKFELECLECAYHTIVNKNQLHDNTRAAMKQREPTILKLVSTYNTLYKQMRTLIDLRTAPPGIVAPPFISQNGIFQLDVDDEIWQDIGLDDDTAEPPLWLSNEDVHMGIDICWNMTGV